jgi:hypothetical protein
MEITVKDWFAWAPALNERDDFVAWARGKKAWGDAGTADVSFLPARFRRRLTPLAKMGLATAYGCLTQSDIDPTEIRTVFCSRFGEHNLTVHILREIFQNEGVSPMRFAMSVHNSTAGLFSIGSGNKKVTTAVSGGKDTFFYALMEAAAMLQHEPSPPVLVVLCEEPLDPIYHGFCDEQQIPHALALLLDGPGTGTTYRLEMSRAPGDVPGNNPRSQPSDVPRALAFLQWMLDDTRTEWVSDVSGRTWTWSKARATADPTHSPPVTTN